MPLYVLIGVAGQSVCLIAFRKQTKKESAYGYQLYLSVSKVLEVLTFAFFSLTCKWWSDLNGTGAAWYMSSYELTWIAAHVSIPLMNFSFTCSLCISIATSADRIYALWKPMKYRMRTSRRPQYVALAISILISLFINVFDCFRFQVSWKGDRYVRKVDEAFVATPTATHLSNLKTLIRCIAVITLLVLNVAIVKLYRRQVVDTMSKVFYTNYEKEKQRRANDKTLTLLTIIQSLVTVFAFLPLTVYYAIAFIVPPFSTCPGPLVASIDDAILQIAEMTNFGFLLVACKPFRTMVRNVLRGVSIV